MNYSRQFKMETLKIDDFKHNSLYDRMNKLLVSYDWSDCTFLVCGKEFKAHRLILAISSPVFEAMFYGPLSTNEIIEITDIDPNIFQLLLNFIYTDKVDIPDIEDAYELLYVSKKYLLNGLSDMCIEYIQSNLSIDNVIQILNYPDCMQEDELLTSALNIFCQHAFHLLQDNKNKLDISICVWKRILQSNQMNMTERDLVKVMFAWIYQYCKKYKLSTDIKKQREVLFQTGLFSLLRLHTLTLDDMENIRNDTFNLLLPEEFDEIIHMIMKRETKEELEYKVNIALLPRMPIELKWCLCHRALIRSESPIIISDHHNSIKTRLKADKTFTIQTLKIYSRMEPVNNIHSGLKNYKEDIYISVISETDNSIIKELNFKEFVEYDRNIDIKLPEPVYFKKDQWYSVHFMWPSLSEYDSHLYSVQSRETSCTMSYFNNKIKFDFQDEFLAESNGSFIRGLKFYM